MTGITEQGSDMRIEEDFVECHPCKRGRILIKILKENKLSANTINLLLLREIKTLRKIKK